MPPSISLVVPDVLTVHEGETVTIPIHAFVPAPAVAQFQFVGMPTGMVHNPAKSQLEWTPDAHAANDPNDPAVTTKTYAIYVTLRSSLDPVRTITKTVVVTVVDKKVSPLAPWFVLDSNRTRTVYQRCDWENCEQRFVPARGDLR
jgi:hypothetical protein